MRPLRILLIGINAGILGAFWALSDGRLSVSSAPESKPRPVVIRPPSPSPQIQHEEISRSLFRGAAPDVENDVPLDEPSGPSIRLLGVILMGDQRIAMVEHDGTILRVGEGDSLDEWQVATIEARAIRLQAAEQQIEVLLDPPASPQQ